MLLSYFKDNKLILYFIPYEFISFILKLFSMSNLSEIGIFNVYLILLLFILKIFSKKFINLFFICFV